ncbi:MAG: hypothetical protein Q9196_003764 [Gyalolechia fulgens]
MTDAMTTATSPYAKCFIPLESDPSVLNDLMYDLRVSKSLALVDVVSIEDPALLGVIPRPALALILVLPTSDGYERHRRSTKKMVEGAGDLKTEAIIWLRQTIDNACGLYAILHAICNFESTGYIRPDSFLSKLCTCSAGNREALLNDSVDLETMYTKAAVRGSTLPPPAEDEVDLHYICFLRSPNGSIYEMDGDAIGPVKTDLSLKHNEDLLDASALECVKRCIARGDADMNFSLLALVANLGDSD